MHRSYRRRALANPYFPRKSRKRRRIRFVLPTLALIAVGLTILWLSPVFAITSVEVQGATSVNSEDIRSRVFSILSRWDRTILFRQATTIEQDLKERFTFQTVSVSTHLPRTVRVVVQERTPFALWRVDERHYVIDEEGAVIRSATPDDANNETLIRFESEQEVVVVDESRPAIRSVSSELLVFPLPKASLGAARTVIETVATQTPLRVIQFRIPFASTSWVKGITDSGVDLYIDLTGPVDAQLAKLPAVLAKVGEGRKKLQYIDLRFGDRAYYQ